MLPPRAKISVFFPDLLVSQSILQKPQEYAKGLHRTVYLSKNRSYRLRRDTSFFPLQRAVSDKPSCPLSGLHFVLAIEFLAQSTRENSFIRGLKIGSKEVKLSLYAEVVIGIFLPAHF